MVGTTIGTVFFNSAKTDYSYPAPTVGYSYNVNSFGINLTPQYGWFITDKVVIGAEFILKYDHQKAFDKDGSTGNTFKEDISSNFDIGIGGFARDYFSTSGSLYPFGQVSVNFGLSSGKSNGFYFVGADKNTYNGQSSGDLFANAGVSFGFTKMVNKHAGLEVFIGYNYSYNKNNFKTTTLTDLGNNGSVDQTSISNPTSKYTNNGVSAGLGFQIFLDRNK
jgi:hypothetical protein